MSDFNQKAILLTPLGEEELPDLDTFDCEDWQTNYYLLNHAFDEQRRGLNTTTLIYYNGVLASFLSACCDTIPLCKEGNNVACNAPAIKIRYAIDKQFKDLEMDAFVIDYAKSVAYDLWCTHVGVRFLTMDVPAAQEDFFAGLGFVRNEEDNAGDIVSMRTDIFY